MQGSWYFVYISDGTSNKIKKLQEGKVRNRGFGAVKVECTMGGSTWQTSIFPTKEGPYILPVKASVRHAEGKDDGDSVSIKCRLI